MAVNQFHRTGSPLRANKPPAGLYSKIKKLLPSSSFLCRSNHVQGYLHRVKNAIKLSVR